MDLPYARAIANKIGEKAKSVNGIFPLLLLLVLAFLLMLGLSRSLDDDLPNEMTFAEEHIDYPKSEGLARYCNFMMLRKKIRNPNETCKKKHIFIHENLKTIGTICTNFSIITTCKYPSRMDCYKSQVKLQLTECRLIEGINFPGCKYLTNIKFKSILLNCNDYEPVNLYGIVENS
ncbi:putative inactive ribonuclease-like protein 12 [Macrotis lagotis]|uniref:putative inactive ribonuclease-like protein 12 n=1 Tax=Macrotis lagotis TaxID=92651 RepID=UPI003D69CE1D